MTMSIDELSDLPLEELMEAVETLGVSSVDELFAMIMNKNVSSASKEEEDSFTSPLSTTVITKAEMRTYGVTTIEEAFRLIPGMIVTEKTNGVYDIQMRGLNNIPDNNMLLYTENANTLLMVDSRPVQNYALGALTLDMLHISIEDIDRIEVVRGACGALYGANAVSGAINIITEKPNASSKILSGSIQMGNKNTMIGDFGLRNAWNGGKIAAGLTFNMQHRGRGTDKLYVMGAEDLYLAESNAAIESRYSQRQIADLSELETDYRLISKGEWMSVEDINNLRLVKRTAMTTEVPTYIIMNATEPQTPISNMIPNPSMSRKTLGVNGYLSFVPNPNVRFDLQAGYQSSDVLSTPVNDDVFSINNRIAKGGYINLNSSIYDLAINLSYDFGPQNYTNGAPGFKVDHNSLNASAEYDIHAGNLHIKPGVSAQWIKYEDYLPVYNSENPEETGDYSWHYEKNGTPSDNKHRLYGFFNGSAKITDIAPSVRLDYKIGEVRLIGAFRSDKTNIPDKWNHSWQLSANYSINPTNFIRFVYGRANRGATMVNSSANYHWIRTNMAPNTMVFVGNKDADLVHIDNYELGYRWKPSPKVLVDAELYVSHSEDYGALMASRTMQVLDGETLRSIFRSAMSSVSSIMTETDAQTQKELMTSLVVQATTTMANEIESRTYVQYHNLPYKVNQYGLSFNMDWIISSKLIAKINANVQQTRIDDYYPYSQTEEIGQQMAGATSLLTQNLASGRMLSDVLQTVMYASGGDMDKAHAAVTSMMSDSPVDEYSSKVGWSNMSADQKEALLGQLKEAGIKGDSYDGLENPLSMYFALCYNAKLNEETGEYFFGSTEALKKEHSDGHKHKATPAVYGMVGLIYKPTTKVNISAFGNYVGKRTMDTAYGSVDMKANMTVNAKVGFTPADNVEIFVNAHNLFNNKEREFVYSDEIGGIYTVGINFGF